MFPVLPILPSSSRPHTHPEALFIISPGPPIIIGLMILNMFTNLVLYWKIYLCIIQMKESFIPKRNRISKIYMNSHYGITGGYFISLTSYIHMISNYKIILNVCASFIMLKLSVVAKAELLNFRCRTRTFQNSQWFLLYFWPSFTQKT